MRRTLADIGFNASQNRVLVMRSWRAESSFLDTWTLKLEVPRGCPNGFVGGSASCWSDGRELGHEREDMRRGCSLPIGNAGR